MKPNNPKTTKPRNLKRSTKEAETTPDLESAFEAIDASPEVATSIDPSEMRAPDTRVTEPMLRKLRRAFLKAGKEASEGEQVKFAEDMISAGVPILNRSSSRIAKVLKGERTLEDLKVSKSRKS
jgi:hypothetical protein